MQPCIVVTGAAGFIGRQLILALNQRGFTRIIAVDCHPPRRYGARAESVYQRFIEKETFYQQLASGALKHIDVIFHQGACSSTIVHDKDYVFKSNVDASTLLLDYCLKKNVRLIYASSAAIYGNAPVCIEDPRFEGPLNFYGYTKYLLDCAVRKRLRVKGPQIVGLRYFNVYGPGEEHKGAMASIICQHVHALCSTGKVSLFGAYGGYGPGEHRRDFIFIDDVIRANLWFFDHPQVRGIFNVGTGAEVSFNQLASEVVRRVRLKRGQASLSFEEMVRRGVIAYRPFPEILRGAYQTHTKADLRSLRQVGCTVSATNIRQAVPRYVDYLLERNVNLGGA